MSQTIVALSTPNMSSALAVIRLSGSDCKKLAIEAMRLKKDPIPRRITRGFYYDKNDNFIDDCTFSYFEENSSYTGEESLEIYTHGNPFIIDKIIEDCLNRGCKIAEPGQFTKKAFLNKKIDLSQAEAVMQVISARSMAALKVAQRQLAGELGKKINDFSSELLKIRAEVEAYIDFPEEDLPKEDPNSAICLLKKLNPQIKQLSQTVKYESILKEGINAVLIGLPNAGKSSLLNCLLGKNRAIVSEIEGTTRDFIVDSIMLGDYKLNLIDTAGLRQTDNKIEFLGVKKTIEEAKSADIVIFVIDSFANVPVLSEEILEIINTKKCIIVENKSDLKRNNDFDKFLPNIEKIRLSSLNSDGIENFKSKLFEVLKKEDIINFQNNIVVCKEHSLLLNEASYFIENATKILYNDAPAELAAGDLREAAESLGKIVGKTDNELLLGEIFSRFCVGK